VNLLLDTHVLLWWLSDDGSLWPEARDAIASQPLVMVSAATAWEIAIMRSIGKLEAPDGLREVTVDQGFAPLPITFEHADHAGALPRIHDDPFDRMLVAQARIEGLAVVTADPRIGAYDVVTLGPPT
jgi:PIN domain nuclease of toxin-antitoxin system